jgi:hypothetical protein
MLETKESSKEMKKQISEVSVKMEEANKKMIVEMKREMEE